MKTFKKYVVEGNSQSSNLVNKNNSKWLFISYKHLLGIFFVYKPQKLLIILKKLEKVFIEDNFCFEDKKMYVILNMEEVYFKLLQILSKENKIGNNDSLYY